MVPYPVPTGRFRAEYLQGNSRFIATLDHAETVDSARETIRAVRAEMPDATHHVYAMKVGFGTSVTEGMSDDGEPTGTSGPPILSILRGTEIGDVVVVVTRYYGGTKLGTGGLVTAYGNAAREVLAVAATILRVPRMRVVYTMEYTHFQRVRDEITGADGIIVGEDFSDAVRLSADCPTAILETLHRTLLDATAGRITIRLS